MSAPKPRVHWDALNQRWATQCDGCRIKGWETSWSATLAMAVEHSRTHTAERVADGLGRSGDEMMRKSMEAHDEIDRQRCEDKAVAYYESAFSVLRHLVN